jgi:hypothetical protein
VLVSQPGFENIVLVLTTDGAGGVTGAAYWTREYIIANGPPIGTDAIGQFNINNSYGGGRITFTGAVPQGAPVTNDDAVTVIQDTATTVSVLADNGNGADQLGSPAPNVLSIDVQPTNGTLSPLTPTATTITYTPNQYYFGTDTFTYRLTDGDNESDSAVVTITIADKTPAARAMAIPRRRSRSSAHRRCSGPAPPAPTS